MGGAAEEEGALERGLRGAHQWWVGAVLLHLYFAWLSWCLAECLSCVITALVVGRTRG